MARVGRQERDAAADLVETLKKTAPKSGFFQIVRLFNRIAQSGGRPGASGVGGLRPREEPVRFRAAVGMRHPAGELVKVEQRDPDAAPELTVSFVGLTGPMGVLPDHYTEFLVDQGQARNRGAADFFDLFNHRVISHFYRAWAKYRLPVRFEESKVPLDDPISRLIASIAGLGLESARSTLLEGDGDLLSVAAVLARKVRTADALDRIVSGLFELPVRISEFEGRWIRIPKGERTKIGASGPQQRFAVLGQTAVVGEQVWDIQGRFQMILGPLDYDDFLSLLWPEPRAKALNAAVRLAIGPARDFDMRLILKRDAVPMMRLSPDRSGPRLGQTSWLISAPPARDRDDAVIPAARAAA